MELPCHGTVRGASPGRAAAGARFQSPTQIDRVVSGWACARVLRFGAAPVGMHYPMIRRAGGVCKAVAQELSNDRRARGVCKALRGASPSAVKVFLILGTRGLGSALQGNESRSKGLCVDEQVVLSDASWSDRSIASNIFQ